MADIRKLTNEEIRALADKLERKEISFDEEIELYVNLGYDEERTRHQVQIDRGVFKSDVDWGDVKPISAFTDEDQLEDEPP